MMNSKLVSIDSEKLRRLIEKRGYTPQEIGEELGYDRSFMGRCLNRGKISPATIRSLSFGFGIKYEDYKPAEDVPPEEPHQITIEEVKTQQETITKSELYHIIFSAVYEAVRKAWSE